MDPYYSPVVSRVHKVAVNSAILFSGYNSVTKQSAGWEVGLDTTVTVDFLEELNKTYAKLCGKAKMYLRNTPWRMARELTLTLEHSSI